jgi:MtN3 and saliva related transmembrane protein
MATQIIIDTIGFIAAACIAANMFPQIYKSWKTKQVDDVSLSMILLVLAGSFLWLIYGILIISFPVILSDTLGTLTSFILLGLKLKYSGGKQNE